jgi:hypothetical protein
MLLFKRDATDITGYGLQYDGHGRLKPGCYNRSQTRYRPDQVTSVHPAFTLPAMVK